MKRLAAVGLVSSAFAAILFVAAVIPRSHAECPQLPCEAPSCKTCGNGDCNGDGVINVADPIYLLGFLFKTGPAPYRASSCPPCPSVRLVATGQTLCYTDSGDVTVCDDPLRPGQDGFYRLGCPMDNRFEKVEVPTGAGRKTVAVIDHCTNLMWQAGTSDIDGDGKFGNPDSILWREALLWCHQLILANDGTWLSNKDDPAWDPGAPVIEQHGGIKHDDWRMPSIVELLSILDYRLSNPAVNKDFFTVFSNIHWTSTTNAASRSTVHGVQLGTGMTASYGKASQFYVLAVRSMNP